MSPQALARRSATGLGVLYGLLGVAETIRLLVTGDGGLVFWFGTLVGGGTLLLVGARGHRDGRHLAAVLVGAFLGVPATAWTLVVPVLALVVVALAVRAWASPVEPAA